MLQVLFLLSYFVKYIVSFNSLNVETVLIKLEINSLIFLTPKAPLNVDLQYVTELCSLFFAEELEESALIVQIGSKLGFTGLSLINQCFTTNSPKLIVFERNYASYYFLISNIIANGNSRSNIIAEFINVDTSTC